MITIYVWEFRVRWHFKQKGRTKKARAALRKKFGPQATPLLDALMDLADLKAQHTERSRELEYLFNPSAYVTELLEQIEDVTDSFERMHESYGQTLPKPVLASTRSFAHRLTDGVHAVRKSLRPVEVQTLALAAEVEALRTQVLAAEAVVKQAYGAWLKLQEAS